MKRHLGPVSLILMQYDSMCFSFTKHTVDYSAYLILVKYDLLSSVAIQIDFLFFSDPVNGGYTDWSAWSTCSKTCGDGFMQRSRKCTNPPPKYGGICVGSSIGNKLCNEGCKAGILNKLN